MSPYTSIRSPEKIEARRLRLRAGFGLNRLNVGTANMAVIQFVRKHKSTPEACLNTHKSQHVDTSGDPALDAVAVAVEHVNHLRRSGVGITQAMAAINLTPERGEGWDAVMWAYASAFEQVRSA